MPNKRLIQALCIVSFIYLFIAQAYYSFSFTVDDAYISLRYAKHLVGGHGLSWNIGEQPLEGYSNFSYVLLASVFYKLNLPALLLIKLFSLCSLLGSFILLYLISAFFLPRSLRLLPSFLMLFHRGEIVWAVSGLETAFYQFLVLLTVYCLLSGLRQASRRWFVIAGLATALAGLTRPEAPMLCIVFMLGLVLCYYYQKEPQQRKFIFHGAGVYGLFFIVFYAPYFIWRWIYFSRFFPNPVYCKAMFSSVPGYVDLQYLSLILPLFVFAIPSLIFSRKTTYYFLIAPSVAYLLAFINADVVVSYINRFFLPAFALFLPLFVSGIYELSRLPALKFDKGKQIVVTAVCVIVLSICLLPLFSALSLFSDYASNTVLGRKQRVRVGLWLKNHLKEGEKASVGDCGLIPFTAEKSFIDSYCLNSREMTSPPINLSYARFADWLIGVEKPKYIILLSLRIKNTAYYPPFDILALRHAGFTRCYKKIKGFSVGDNQNGYFYDIYSKNSSNCKS